MGEGEASGGFDKFFFGILEIASVFDFGVFVDLLAGFLGVGFGLVEQGLGFGVVMSVDVFDAFAGGLDEGSGGFECFFAGGVFRLHFGFEVVDGLFPGHGLYCSWLRRMIMPHSGVSSGGGQRRSVMTSAPRD